MTYGIEPKPRIRVGLVGAGIGPSLSPALHEEEGRRQGFSYTYCRFDLTDLGLDADGVRSVIDEARGRGYRGLNVTHPSKRAVIAHLRSLSPVAAELQAVNTVVFEADGPVGHNTDCDGFARAFQRGLAGVSLQRVVQVGGGGAGAAVAHAILSLGAERLAIHDRDPETASALAHSLRRRFGDERVAAGNDLVAELVRADGVIHATPTGMASHPGMPFDASLLRPELWVAEVVYRPLETELLRHARKLGCRTLDGGGMAVIQAALSFELFTGREANVDRMTAHLHRLLAAEAGPP
ncbi:MAG TPA: shikimate dehydrogenase [Solirubrobacteraceae bacterium]|nr:shikimate dehydrogenase [Solirubrobacteraceae bacterium]